jgi:hypothetical protein
MSDDDSSTVRINRLIGESGMTSHASREPNKIIVRFLSVLEEVMIKYAHPPLFKLVSLGEKLRRSLRVCLVLVHSLAAYSSQAATLVV